MNGNRDSNNPSRGPSSNSNSGSRLGGSSNSSSPSTEAAKQKTEVKAAKQKAEADCEAAKQKAKAEAAKQKAEAETAEQKAKVEAAKQKAEAEVAKQKAEAEVAKQKAEAEAAKQKAEVEAAKQKAEATPGTQNGRVEIAAEGVEAAKGKVAAADMVVIFATTEDMTASWMEVDDAASAGVTQDRAARMTGEEAAIRGDTGTTYAAESGCIFSFHGHSLLETGINECWELPSLADTGWFDEESQQIDEAIHAGVLFFMRNAITAEALERQAHQQQITALVQYRWDHKQASKERIEEKKHQEQQHGLQTVQQQAEQQSTQQSEQQHAQERQGTKQQEHCPVWQTGQQPGQRSEQKQNQYTETAGARWLRWKTRLLSKERVRVARKKVAEAVATWREEERLRAWYKQPWTGYWFKTEKEAAEDTTVGKAKVTEDLAVWVEQRSKCKQLTQGEQLSYGLQIIDIMMSRGFPSAWAGMAA